MRPEAFSRSLRIAEALLRLVVPAPSAAAIIGDLEEDLGSDEGRKPFPRAWLFSQVGRHAIASLRPRDVNRPSVTRWIRTCRYALRPWRRQPATAALAILILGAAFGAHTALFGLLDAVVFKPLPIDSADQLVAIGTIDQRGRTAYVSSAVFEQLLAHPPFLPMLAGYLDGRMTVEARNTISHVPVGLVTGEFFDVVHGHAIVGRLLVPADLGHTAASTAHVAVIGARFWQTALQGDSRVIGETLRVEGVPLVIIGVAPEQVTGLHVEAMNDVVLPATLMPQLVGEPDVPDSMWFHSLIGRRSGDQTVRGLNAQLAARWPSVVAAASPGTSAGQAARTRPTLISAASGFSFLRTTYESVLRLLTGLASLMIVVGCVSVGSLIAASAVARRPEFLVRMALGASRLDIASQVFAEAAVICGAGALLGFAVGSIAMRPALNWLWSDVNLRDVNLSPDWRLLVFAIGTTLAATVVAALVPALLTTTRASQVGLLNSRTVSSTRGRWQGYALVTQLSMTLTLLVGAGLFVRTLARERPADALDSGQRLVARLVPLPNGYASQTDATYYAALVSRLTATPGVVSAAIAKGDPFGGLGDRRAIELEDSPPGERSLSSATAYVSPGFFSTIGATLLEGRDFTWTDTKANEVAVLSASLASRLFPAGSALGRQVRLRGDSVNQTLRIVGIVADTRYHDIQEPHPLVIYLSNVAEGLAQWGSAVIRLAAPSAVSMDVINQVLRTQGHEYAMWVHTFAQEEDMDLLKPRLAASIGVLFAVLSGLLASTGVYGRLSQIVAQRRKEVDIRLALGATPSRIRTAIVREGARTAVWALVIGVPISVALARVASGQFNGLAVDDPLVFGGSTVLLFALAVGASYGPARRVVRERSLGSLRGD
jgi:putative ABC transport system permease protein